MGICDLCGSSNVSVVLIFLLVKWLFAVIVEQQTERTSKDASEMDTTCDPTKHGDSFESWPSLIHGSTTAILPAEDSNIRFMLWASFAEIYKEQIFDLLEVSTVSTGRQVRPSTLHLRDGDGRPYIAGLREVHVCSVEEAWRLVQIGRENQHIAATRLNRASSRSHSIFTLRLIQVADVDQPNVARVASLSFCDLAGSERNTTSCGFNERLKEANNINLSLMTLGRCIEALRKNQARRDQSAIARASIIVPFRDSRLTRMFQSFLCGEGRVIMITNISPCANVFDETLHAVNYSALASQVVVGPSAPLYAQSTSILMPHADKHKVPILGKHDAGVPTSKAVMEKKRKCDTIQEMDKVEDTAKQHDEDECFVEDDEDAEDLWNEERQKLLSAIEKLQNLLNEQHQSKVGLETQIRAEVCEEMQKQLVRIEFEYQENIRRREEILEEKYDRKMEIYMEAVQKSCKRQRRADDEDLSSIDLHAAEVKLSKCVDEISELKKELAMARDNITKLSAERDAIAEKLTKCEFSASDALRQEKTQARAECAKLKKTVEELTSKLSDAEHRHEVSCRQLRREKAQLEHKLNAAGKMARNQDHESQNAAMTDIECDKSEYESKIAELEAAVKKERGMVKELEQHLNEAKVVEKTWAEHCKGVEAVCQEKIYELTKLQEKYDALECSMQETINTLEQAKQDHSQADDMVQAARSDLGDKEEQLKALISLSESLKEEITRLTVESENERKNLMAELEAKEEECEKIKIDITDLKQQASNVVDSSDDKLTVVQHELSIAQQKLKETEDEKASTVDLLRSEIAKLTNSADSSEDKVTAVQHELEVMQEKLEKAEEKASTVDLLRSEIAKLTTHLLEGKDELNEKISMIGQLEEDLETERNRQSELEEKVTEYEKKLVESSSDLSQEKDKYLALESSLEKVQNQLDVETNARKKAEEETASHMSALTSYEAKMESAKKKLDSLKEQLKDSEDCEMNLKQQLSSSSQQFKELQKKHESGNAELASRDKELQTCHKTISDLKQKMEEEHVLFESALTAARSNDGVIEQMKLTMTEQEMTMKTQDQLLQEHDNEVQSLKEKLDEMDADYHCQSESLSEQVRQKNTRIRELEKEVDKLGKSRVCLEKDVRDTTSELKSSERNLAEVKKELAATKQEVEKLKSDETSAKSSAKRELELSNVRKQLEVAQDKLQKCDRDMAKLNNQFQTFQVDKENELSAWREKRDKLVAELEKSILDKDAEIKRLKAVTAPKCGHGRRDRQPSSGDAEHQMEALQKQVERLTRAASAKEQTIVDMRDQNLQLQHEICQLQQQGSVAEVEENSRRRSRKSRIPTSQRLPLRVTDTNADLSMGVLADGAVAVDLDETVGARKRQSTRRYHAAQPKPSEISDEQHYTRASRTRRKRTTGARDTMDSVIAEEPSPARRLRTRRY